MVVVQYLLLALEIIVSLMLLLVILVQRTKSGGGMGSAFGGGVGESMFGSRAGNVLTKATVVLSTVFMLNTLGLAILFSRQAAAGESVGAGGALAPIPTAPAVPTGNGAGAPAPAAPVVPALPNVPVENP